MKKILLSLLSIGAVAVVAVAATGAFFSDTETSQDNTFTAGELDLQIDSECHYYQNGVDVGCFHNFPSPTPSIAFGNWPLDDLTTEKFFWFDDVKPGDYGENTISLHVFDNDAWVCMDISPLENNDKTCTNPEGVSEGGSCGIDPDAGELAENLDFFAWLDDGATNGFQCSDTEPDEGAGCGDDPQEGDNVWQNGSETALFSNVIGPASDVLDGRTYTLADSTGSVIGGPFIGSSTYYIGVAWCAGDMTLAILGQGDMTGQPNLNCNGLTMGNDTQTDSVVADLTFRAEQSRNNPDFRCVPPQRIDRTQEGFGDGGWAGWSCPAGTTAIGGGIDSSTNPVGGNGVAATGAPAVDGFNYPVYPHYTFSAGETGYVVHDLVDGLPNNITFHVDCLPN